MKSVINLLTFLLSVNLVICQIILPGNCPDYQAIKDFEVSKYLGKWYSIQHYEAWFSKGGECNAAEYSLNDDGSVRVYNSNKKNGVLSDITGLAVPSYPEQSPLEGKLNVTFFGEPNRSNYWILDTDYINYTIVWSCSSSGVSMHAEFAWIMARTPYIDGDVLDKVNANIDRYFKRDKLEKVNQNADLCFS